jgi:hypothetical protein
MVCFNSPVIGIQPSICFLKSGSQAESVPTVGPDPTIGPGSESPVVPVDALMSSSGNWGHSDKCLYTFKIDTISTITNRIIYHQIKVNINCWPWWISQHLPVLLDHQF